MGTLLSQGKLPALRSQNVFSFPVIARNENGAKISPHYSIWRPQHPSLRGRHAPLLRLPLEKACEHMSLKCLDEWKRAGGRQAKGGQKTLRRAGAVRQNQTPSLQIPPAVFTGQKKRGTPTRATEAAGRDDLREKETGRQVPVRSLAIHTVTGVSIVACNCTAEGLRGESRRIRQPTWRGRVKRFSCEHRTIRHK